jgi:hypothetical protein
MFILDHSIEIMAASFILLHVIRFIDEYFITHRDTMSAEELMKRWVNLQWRKEFHEKK